MHITILITTSSMIIPAISGAIFFGEAFSIPKMVSLLFLIFFIFIASNKDENTTISHQWIANCFLTFLLFGAIGVLQKIHQNSIHKDELFGFLTVAFFCSLVFAGVLAKKQKASLKNGHIILALLCGVCTFSMNLINLKLSGMIPSQIFFPLVNGGSIVLSSIVSLFFFKETTNKKQIVGLVGGIVALICICIF